MNWNPRHGICGKASSRASMPIYARRRIAAALLGLDFAWPSAI